MLADKFYFIVVALTEGVKLSNVQDAVSLVTCCWATCDALGRFACGWYLDGCCSGGCT